MARQAEHAPWAKLDNEKPKGETIAYDELIKRWTERPVDRRPSADGPAGKRRRQACAPRRRSDRYCDTGAGTWRPIGAHRALELKKRRRSASAPRPTSTRRTSSRRGGLQHPSRHDACRQDDADAADGRARAADLRRDLVRRQERTGVPVQKRNVSMVYQQFINYPNFTVYENIASPLRVAGMRQAEIEHRVTQHGRARCSSRRCCSAARTSCRAGSSSARRSRAPSSRMPISSCSTSRSPISTTSSGRSCATSCRSCSPAGTASSSTPRPSRIEALLLGGTHGDPQEGRVTQFGPTARDLSSTRRPRHRPGLLRSADQHGRRHQAR